MVRINLEFDVLSIPAGDSIQYIYNHSVHAHPDLPNGYRYKPTTYVSFRKKGGVMERLYKVEKVLILDPFDKTKLESFKLENHQRNQINNYIDERIFQYGFGSPGELYKFYIMKPEKELPHKPACPRIQGHTYFTIDELLSGKQIVERATKK